MNKIISILLILLLVLSAVSVSDAISITKSYNTSRSKDHFYLVLEVSDEGTLYYALSTAEENIQSTDLISPTNENFVSTGNKTSVSGGTEIAIQIDDISPDISYEFYAVFINTPGNRSNVYHETIYSVNYINSMTYDKGVLENRADDKIIISLNKPYSASENTVAELKIGNVKTETSNLALLHSGTDFEIKQIDEYSISLDLTSQSLMAFDDQSDWSNVDSYLSSIFLYDSSNEFGIGETFEFNFNLDWLPQNPPDIVDELPKLTSISYENFTGFTNDSFTVHFDRQLTNYPDESNIIIMFDDEADGSFIETDYSLNITDYSISPITSSAFKINLNESSENVMKLLKHNTIAKVTVISSSSNSIHVDTYQNNAVISLPGQNSELAALTVSGQSVIIESGKFSYNAFTSYFDFDTIISSPSSYIQYTPIDSSASFNLSTVTSGVITISGLSSDGLNNSEYLLTLSSQDVRLADIMVNGVSLNQFNSNTLEYNINVPAEYQIPTVTWSAFDTESQVSTSTSGSLPGTYELSLTVVSGQTSLTYKLIFKTEVLTDNPNSNNDNNTNNDSSTITDNIREDDDSDNDDRNNNDSVNSNDEASESTLETKVNSVIDTISNLTSISDTNNPTIVEVNLKKLDDTITDSSNEKEIAKTAQSLSLLVKELSTKAIAENNNTKSSAETIKKVGEYVEKLIIKINDNNEKVIQIENFTKSIKELKNSNIGSKDLDKIVDDIVTNTSKTMSKVVVESKRTVGPLDKFIVDSESLDVSIKGVVDTADKLNQVIKEYFGEDNYIQLKKEVQINIDVAKEEQSVQVLIDKDVVTSLKNNEIDNVNIKVDSSELTLDSESLDLTSSYEFVLQRKDISLQSTPVEIAVVDSLINNKRYVDVTLFKDGSQVGNLSKPATLTFDINYFGYNEDEEISELSVYKFDEEAGIWEPVGGIYDPQTNTISVKRIHLSKYTVMKTKKTISGVGDDTVKDDVLVLLNKGVIKGDIGDMQANITREEFITWLGQSYGLTSNNGDVPFTDLDPQSDSYKFIASVYEQGIITGKSSTNLGTSDYVTYEEVAVILANTLTKLDNKKINNNLTAKLDALGSDIQISDWAKDEVALVIELGYMDKSVALNSKGYITREQAAAIFNSFYS